MFSLWQYQRLTEGTDWERDLTPWVRNTWRRTIRARGGFWTGDFVISGLSEYAIQQLYSVLIGKRIVETSFGLVTWEGEITGLSMTLNGVTQEQSLDVELWHNRVKCQYVYPTIDDIEQGVLTYNPIANSFQDTLQDFSEWETLAGDAIYEITVTNNDGTTAQAYLGAAFNTLNPNDSILVYTDVPLTTAGWNGTVAAKVPITYVVSNVLLSGTQQETAWSESADSSDIYGEANYIDVLADEMYAVAADAARDRRLEEYAYPRSIPTGGLSSDQPRSGPNRLSATCAGYVFSMNRRFYETDVEPLDVSLQIATLVAASEYVGDGGILENATIQVPLTGADMTYRLWDGLEGLVALGDTSGNRYVGGVYQGRLFRYDLAATDLLYEWKEGQLRYATGQRVWPTLITPDIQVRLEAPLVIAPPGATWQTPTQTWISECEFIAPNSYRLVPDMGDVLAGTWGEPLALQRAGG